VLQRTTSGSQLTPESKGHGKIQNNKIAKEIIIPTMIIIKPLKNKTNLNRLCISRMLCTLAYLTMKNLNPKQNFKAEKNKVRGLPLAGKK
jgi:hypothetical protein